MLVIFITLQYHVFMAILPPSFKLDSHGEIRRALEEDPVSTLIDIEGAFIETKYYRLAGPIADLIVPGLEGRENAFFHQAFISGALIGAASFEEADVSQEERMLALGSGVIQSVPGTFLTSSESERLEAVRSVADEALQAHSEIRDVAHLVIRHHVAISQNSVVATYVTAGMGFMTAQLEHAWQHVRAVQIDQACAQEMATIDWKSYPKE
jgi:hypothetical protein